MRVDDAIVAAHHVAHLGRDFAHLVRIRADHPELHGKADRRPEVEPIDAHPRRAQRAVGDRRLDPRLDPLARLDVLGDDDDLGEGFVRLHRLQAEPEPRRALADVGRVARRVLVARDQLFGFARDLFGRADRAALGEPQFEEQLGPLRQREELLLHLAELAEADAEHGDRDGDDDERPRDAELQRAAERAVESRRIDRLLVAPMTGFRVARQELVADERREQHRDEPGRDQRDADHPENAAGVFAGRGIGEADRHEAGGGDERARQHRKRRRGPGERGRSLAVPALLELYDDRFDRDDRVVDEQAERDDQRAERDPLQVETHHRHRDEHDREHERNGSRDDQPRPPAERQEPDAEHYGERLEERAGEFEHRGVDHLGLIGDARDDNSLRQVGLELRERRVQRLAEREDIAALLHHDAHLERGPALRADEPRRRILVAVRDQLRYRRAGTSGRWRRRASPRPPRRPARRR